MLAEVMKGLTRRPGDEAPKPRDRFGFITGAGIGGQALPNAISSQRSTRGADTSTESWHYSWAASALVYKNA
jgi:hypothetical protein